MTTRTVPAVATEIREAVHAWIRTLGFAAKVTIYPEHVTDLVSRLASAPAAPSGWLPIETAPPGEPVLVLAPWPNSAPFVGEATRDQEHLGGGWRRPGGKLLWPRSPTHFQPLPPPPETEEPR